MDNVLTLAIMLSAIAIAALLTFAAYTVPHLRAVKKRNEAFVALGKKLGLSPYTAYRRTLLSGKHHDVPVVISWHERVQGFGSEPVMVVHAKIASTDSVLLHTTTRPLGKTGELTGWKKFGVFYIAKRRGTTFDNQKAVLQHFSEKTTSALLNAHTFTNGVAIISDYLETLYGKCVARDLAFENSLELQTSIPYEVGSQRLAEVLDGISKVSQMISKDLA